MNAFQKYELSYTPFIWIELIVNKFRGKKFNNGMKTIHKGSNISFQKNYLFF